MFSHSYKKAGCLVLAKPASSFLVSTFLIVIRHYNQGGPVETQNLASLRSHKFHLDCKCELYSVMLLFDVIYLLDFMGDQSSGRHFTFGNYLIIFQILEPTTCQRIIDFE